MKEDEIIEELKMLIEYSYFAQRFCDGVFAKLLRCTLDLIYRKNAEIEKNKAADVVTVAHGSLKHTGSECSQRWVCTNCNEIAYYPRRGIRKKRIFQPCGYKFCPNCGAKMDIQEENKNG